MSRIRTTLRLVLIASMIIAALASSQVSAQRPGASTTGDEGTYASEMTGLEFTWSDDWELAGTDVSDEEEILELESEFGILFTGFGLYTDAEEARDEVIGGFESGFDEITTIDEDESRGFAWTMVEGVSGTGESVFVYVEVEEDVEDDWDFITVIATGGDVFVDQYELVNDTVEMDGVALVSELDVDEVEELLESSTGSVDDESTPDTGARDETETGRAGADDDGASDSYVFETADLEVVVSGDIEINESQIEDDVYEQILLVGVGSIGAVSLLQSPGDAEDTLDGFMSGFLQEMEDSQEIEVDVDGEIAWGLYEANVGGMDMYIYAVVNDDLHDGHYLELLAAPVDFFEDEFIAYQESVEVNGTGMFDGIDVDDLLDIIDAA